MHPTRLVQRCNSSRRIWSCINQTAHKASGCAAVLDSKPNIPAGAGTGGGGAWCCCAAWRGGAGLDAAAGAGLGLGAAAAATNSVSAGSSTELMSTSKLMKPTCALARHGERLLMLLLSVCCTDAVDEYGGLHTWPYKLAACFREPGPEPHIFDPTSVDCGEELWCKGICQC